MLDKGRRENILVRKGSKEESNRHKALDTAFKGEIILGMLAARHRDERSMSCIVFK
jgi:hypothetical protein